MNIVFRNKLAHDCWHTLCQYPEHHEFLVQWMSRMLTSDYQGGPKLDNIPIAEGTHPARPDWKNQSGTMTTLELYVNSSDCYLIPPLPGAWGTQEFGWAVWTHHVDEYGASTGIPASSRPIMVGGLVNHGDHESPAWSSHT